MALPIVPKDPDAELPYGFNWETWLGSDTLSGSTWIMPSGLNEESSTYSDTATAIWISGGTAGQVYRVTNRVTFTGGGGDDRSFLVDCKER